MCNSAKNNFMINKSKFLNLKFIDTFLAPVKRSRIALVLMGVKVSIFHWLGTMGVAWISIKAPAVLANSFEPNLLFRLPIAVVLINRSEDSPSIAKLHPTTNYKDPWHHYPERKFSYSAPSPCIRTQYFAVVIRKNDRSHSRAPASRRVLPRSTPDQLQPNKHFKNLSLHFLSLLSYPIRLEFFDHSR
jgi:hypothetical protein